MAGAVHRLDVRPVIDTDRLLADVRDLIEPAHRAAIDDLGSDLRTVAGYHAGWWDADGRPDRKPGKAIRPAFVLACARAVAGDHVVDDPDVVSAAVAIELVHDFSLLHDDVMDGDRTRRHRPSAWVVYGESRAILTGDAMVALALGRAGCLAGVLAAAVLDLCEGQSADLAADAGTDVARCLGTAERKTGSLLGAACELGALAAGADEDTAGHYRAFGRQIGVAFQLVDDLLGIWGDPARTGKPAHSDLIARRRSLPVVAAMAADSPEARLLGEFYARRTGGVRSPERIAWLVDAAGGRAWAEDEVERRARRAVDHLRRARPRPGAARDLRDIARLIIRRDH